MATKDLLGFMFYIDQGRCEVAWHVMISDAYGDYTTLLIDLKLVKSQNRIYGLSMDLIETMTFFFETTITEQWDQPKEITLF